MGPGAGRIQPAGWTQSDRTMGFRTFLWLAVMLASPALSPVGASAQESVKGTRPLAVVELFTSQGCGACPPADALLSRLADRGDVVALAFHVDYWDYLGWRDTLGSAENTARQSAYGKHFGSRSVYTPQIVVNGRKPMSGGKTRMVESAITHLESTGAGLTVEVSARYTKDSLLIEAGAAPGGGKAHVVVAFFEPATPIDIREGKNRGRKVVYRNSVLATQSVGMWHGKAARFELPITEMKKRNAGGCAVLLQAVSEDGLPGEIYGATIVAMPSS